MADKLKNFGNFDELNAKGYIVVKGKPEASIKDYELVKGKPEASIKDYELVKGRPSPIDKGYTVVPESGGGKLSKVSKATGKLAAIGAALAAAGKVMAGESPDWKTIGKGAAEALNPVYADAAFGELAKSESLSRDDFKKMREEKATHGALEFGDKLAAMKKDKVDPEELKSAMMSRKK